jgi:hypothetical protein
MVAVVKSIYGGISSSGGIAAAPATPVNAKNQAGGGGVSISNYLPPVGGGVAHYPNPVGDSNPPTGFGSLGGNFGNGDAGPPIVGPHDLQNIGSVPSSLGGSGTAQTQYIVEQFTNTVTGQSWYVPRSTNNVNDGLLPIDPVFQQQFKSFGSGKFKKIIALVGQSANDLVNYQTTLNNIVKTTQTNAKANNQNYLPPRIVNTSLPFA